MPLALLDSWPCDDAQGVTGVTNLADKLDKCKEAWDDEFCDLVRNYNKDMSQKYSARR
jgi:hypothetical protein